jgi:hypothetical protein
MKKIVESIWIMKRMGFIKHMYITHMYYAFPEIITTLKVLQISKVITNKISFVILIIVG